MVTEFSSLKNRFPEKETLRNTALRNWIFNVLWRQFKNIKNKLWIWMRNIIKKLEVSEIIIVMKMYNYLHQLYFIIFNLKCSEGIVACIHKVHGTCVF
jgi:hypothetical protein